MIKKIILILIFIFISPLVSISETQKGQIDYTKDTYLPKNKDIKIYLNQANADMLKFQGASSLTDKMKYLESAMRKYYIATKIDSANIEANIGLARTYDIMHLDSFAKEYFYKAGNIDPYNPYFNYHFANFFYKRNNYLNAQKYYNMAFKHGLSYDFDLNFKLGMVYEKLADLETAKHYYRNAYQIKPDDLTLQDKIRLLEELNYSDSQYYLFMKKD